MKRFDMDMTYMYKGSINSVVSLKKNENHNTISVITYYGEVVEECATGNRVAMVLKDLDDGKYA